MRELSWSCSAALLLLAAACSSGAQPDGGGSTGGTADAGPDAGSACTPACGSGQTCQAGKCVALSCATSANCPAPLTCVNGYCGSGTCNPPCNAAQVCVNQLCVDENPCGAGETVCGSGCARLGDDPANCGGCGAACGTGEVCALGHCAINCVPGETLCGKLCTSLATDGQNCGACGTACPAGQVCSAGACAASCGTGFAICGAGSASYCAGLQDDPGNCGSCGTVCGKGLVCSRGLCAATCSGLENLSCGGLCVDSQTDGQSCGACGTTCGAGLVCSGGACAASCGLPLTVCGSGSGGYCASLLEDTKNCGACGSACTPGQVCADGQCADSCEGALGTLCSGVCVHLSTDNANCGGCGNACGGGTVCNGYSVCAASCGSGYGLCGAGALQYCAGLQVDRDNCGACGRVCPVPQQCVAGVCGAAPDGGMPGDAGPDAGSDAGLDAGPCSTSSCADGCACPSGEVCNGGACQAGCLVGATYYAEAVDSPQSVCLSCQPATSVTSFSATPDGLGCTEGGGNFCQAGSCVSGCLVGATVYTAGTVDPTNACQSCEPQGATSAFTALPAGTPCNTSGGNYCNGGTCVVGCYLDGGAIASGVANPINPCQSCQPQATVGGYSSLPEGTGCNFNGGDFCHAGACLEGCFITNVFYISGASNPQNSCQVCTPAKSNVGWTAVSNATTCGSGGYCNNGNCITGCDIAGTVYPGGAYNTQYGTCCLPAVSPTSWTPELGTASEYATGNAPSGLVLGDFNEDGLIDVAVANTGDDTISLYLGQGDGGLLPIGTLPTGHAPVAMAVADFNLDNHLDLAVSDRADIKVGILFGHGDGGFGPIASYAAGTAQTDSIAVGDVDGKNGPDVMVSNGTAGAVSVLLNSGTGTLGAPTSYPLASPNVATGTIAAYEEFGTWNIFLANTNAAQSSAVGLLLDSAGIFGAETDYAFGGNPVSVAVADVNGDGYLDFVSVGTPGTCEPIEVRLGFNGTGPASAGGIAYGGDYLQHDICYGAALAIGDVNGDGYPDLAYTSPSSDLVVVLTNNGSGAFTGGADAVFPVSAQLQSPGASIAIADFNGDGRNDVLVLSAEATVGGGGTLSVLYNQCP